MGSITICENCGQPLNLIYRFCANCGSAVREQSKSEPEMENHVEESIIEIRLKKPVMIGKYRLSLILTSLIYFLAATFLFTSLINESNVPRLILGIFSLVLGFATFFESGNSKIEKRCPHCRRKIKFVLAQDVVNECPYCTRKTIVEWE